MLIDAYQVAYHPVQAVSRGARLDQTLCLGQAVDIEPDDLMDCASGVAKDLSFVNASRSSFQRCSCAHGFLLINKTNGP
jgi:hypothetical protein